MQRSSLNLRVLNRFSKNHQVSDFIKIRPEEAEFVCTDRQTDGQTDGQTGMTELMIAFRNFAKGPENGRN